jgi:hypothetical protein
MPNKEIQLKSVGIMYELKGWMSHGAVLHVCAGYNVTYVNFFNLVTLNFSLL